MCFIKVWTDDDVGVQRKVFSLVKAAFGDKPLQHLEVDEKTTDVTVPNGHCIYVLEDGRWSEQHPCFGDETAILCRIPGTHPG